MTKIKRFTALIAALLVAVVSCSCDTGKTPSDSSSGGEESNVSEVVGMESYENVSILDFGAKNDGSEDIEAACKKAAESLGEKQALYFPAGTYLVSGTYEITCPIRLDGSVTIDIAAGNRLTISGMMDAGDQKIFTGSGAVSVTSPYTWGYPSWVDNGGMNQNQLLQKAIDSLRCIYVTEPYNLNGLEITSPTSLRGVGSMKVELSALNGTQYMFHIKSGDVSIENFDIDMNRAGEGAVCFYFDTQAASMKNVTLKDIDITSGYKAIADADADNTVEDVLISGVQFIDAKDTPLVMKDFIKGIKLVEVSVMRRDATGGNCAVPGAIVENTEGMRFEHFDVNGDVTKYQLDGHGIVFRNCKGVEMVRTLMEYHGGTGFVIENCSDFYFENAQVYTFYNLGYDIRGLKNSTFNDVKVTYTNLENVSLKKDNIRLEDCEGVTFNSVITANSRGSGLVFKNCKDVTINSLVSSKRLGAAIQDEGGNSNVLISGFIDDVAGNSISLKDEGITITNAIIGTNAPVDKITGSGNY